MVTIAIRVRPGASRTAVGGSYPGPYGPALVVAVGARPVDGQATTAALRALADAIGVRPSALRLKAGAASRDKLVELDDPPAGLDARVAALLESGR
ncbi:DUF167 domain-containing protein [Dactylosporangium sucinum]|uniref:UPF0235 protein GCM10007977_105840 n=1 Tax=Dactylosporangium sucinum TaxID=1424081 RepID=A0A917UG28_9ACTN|nr:DUF167 domain-containing protein [Dactylosporangium sucinum]GGM86770.1 hypothetical protein GCM10007977_105840 [Dactylosporangium sucinum]